MPASLDDAALDRLFRTARTANAFRAEPVPEATLRALYELLKWGPTAANAAPARFSEIGAACAHAQRDCDSLISQSLCFMA